MNSYEFNKVAAAVLLAGIILMVTGMLGAEMVKPKALAEPAYQVAGLAKAEPKETAVAAVALEPIAPLLASASVEEGANQAKKCAACHGFDKGGANKVGPNLWGVVGADHAKSAGFAYSAALAGMRGKPWSFEELNAFLANPKAYAPGTKMAFAGLRKPEERAALIVYLRAQSDSPVPLP